MTQLRELAGVCAEKVREARAPCDGHDAVADADRVAAIASRKRDLRQIRAHEAIVASELHRVAQRRASQDARLYLPPTTTVLVPADLGDPRRQGPVRTSRVCAPDAAEIEVIALQERVARNDMG